MKLAKITTEVCGLRQSNGDGELCMRHQVESGWAKLVALMAKHVDDLKLTGAREVVEYILQQIATSLW